MRDSAECPHAARNHHHCVERVRAAGKRDIHALASVLDHPYRKPETCGQLFRKDRVRIVAQDDVHLVQLGV